MQSKKCVPDTTDRYEGHFINALSLKIGKTSALLIQILPDDLPEGIHAFPCFSFPVFTWPKRFAML